MNQQQATELASTVQSVLEQHLPELQTGVRFTNGEWYVVVRKKIIERTPSQKVLFEEDQDEYGAKLYLKGDDQ